MGTNAVPGLSNSGMGHYQSKQGSNVRVIDGGTNERDLSADKAFALKSDEFVPYGKLQLTRNDETTNPGSSHY